MRARVFWGSDFSAWKCTLSEVTGKVDKMQIPPASSPRERGYGRLGMTNSKDSRPQISSRGRGILNTTAAFTFLRILDPALLFP